MLLFFYLMIKLSIETAFPVELSVSTTAHSILQGPSGFLKCTGSPVITFFDAQPISTPNTERLTPVIPASVI